MATARVRRIELGVPMATVRPAHVPTGAKWIAGMQKFLRVLPDGEVEQIQRVAPPWKLDRLYWVRETLLVKSAHDCPDPLAFPISIVGPPLRARYAADFTAATMRDRQTTHGWSLMRPSFCPHAAARYAVRFHSIELMHLFDLTIEQILATGLDERHPDVLDAESREHGIRCLYHTLWETDPLRRRFRTFDNPAIWYGHFTVEPYRMGRR